jgi:hypothetical protein
MYCHACRHFSQPTIVLFFSQNKHILCLRTEPKLIATCSMTYHAWTSVILTMLRARLLSPPGTPQSLESLSRAHKKTIRGACRAAELAELQLKRYGHRVITPMAFQVSFLCAFVLLTDLEPKENRIAFKPFVQMIKVMCQRWMLAWGVKQMLLLTARNVNYFIPPDMQSILDDLANSERNESGSDGEDLQQRSEKTYFPKAAHKYISSMLPNYSLLKEDPRDMHYDSIEMGDLLRKWSELDLDDDE